MAPSLKVTAEGNVVVKLAVVDCPDGSKLVGERLMPTFEIDDAQTTHAEGQPRLNACPAVVRSAMGHDVGQPVENS